ncbi:MAG: PEP-CTERM sorting domain-containing protein [Thermodesulfobacteriota bacterium]|nr:PEP-CTERM sorting domain-containing protein [Thermodesulfobacteriota bacterium]
MKSMDWKVGMIIAKSVVKKNARCSNSNNLSKGGGKMKKTYLATLVAGLLVFGMSVSANSALITFDDAISGATSYAFDGDGDSVDDVIFSTTDPGGFNTAGPGPNMTYIDEPGLEGTSLLPTDLRVDFLVGAEDSLSFGFALNLSTEDGTASFSIYDASDNLLASITETGLFTDTGGGTSSDFPEGYISLAFAGTAAYATFDFVSDPEFGRYIIDNFEGNFGTTEIDPIPEPSTILLMGAGLLGLVGYGRKRLNKKA